MPLLTTHTRLEAVLDAARSLRAEAVVTSARLAGDAVNIGFLADLSHHYTYLIATICDPYETDIDLAAYADAQFATSFYLATRIAGVRTLLTMAINAVATILSPHGLTDRYTENSVLVGGEIVAVASYLPTDTASLKAVVDMIVSNIPE